MKSEQILCLSLFFSVIIAPMQKRKSFYAEHIDDKKGKKKKLKKTETDSSKNVLDNLEPVKENEDEKIKRSVVGKLAYCIIDCCSNIDSGED